MTMISTMNAPAKDGYAELVRELQAEFQCADVDALAERIVAAEAADFYWEARVKERYLGQHVEVEIDANELSDELVRVACLSQFARRWHVGTFLVNGEGQAIDLVWIRVFDDRGEAEIAFLGAR